MNKDINLTEEMINELIEAYKSNQETIYELDSFIEQNGYLDNGLTDIHETFEMGYNNALEYVFAILGIKDYATKSESSIEDRIENLKSEIEYEKKKMECCGYGKIDLLHLSELEDELSILESQL